jgi:TetR/AcrR family tetracycline transcriptional repressor
MTGVVRVGNERNLAREQIVAAALELLNEVGFAKMTVRQLASKLRVQAAALYWHFKNKQALIDAMAVAIMAPQAFEPPRAWRALLAGFAQYNRARLMAYRDGAQVIAHANIGAQHVAMERVEMLFKRLVDAGLPYELAASSYSLVGHFTLGWVFEEQADPRFSAAAPHESQQKRALTESYPTLSAVFTAFGAGSLTQMRELQFEHALTIILDGIQVRLDALPKVA